MLGCGQSCASAVPQGASSYGAHALHRLHIGIADGMSSTRSTGVPVLVVTTSASAFQR